MYEVVIGVLFAAGSIGSYLLAAKVVGHARSVGKRARRGANCRERRASRALTTKDLSKHFDAR